MHRFLLCRLHCSLAAALLLAAALPGFSQTMNTNTPATNTLETATFGGGCFWCLEALFDTLPGVKSVVSGYAGGQTTNPTYQEVCGGQTGHAEVVQIEFDPAKISFAKLLDWFWLAHDPTTLNRQGNDVGTQYRSVIYYANDAQRAAAETSKAAAQQDLARPIVTEIIKLPVFYRAEEYHQDYFRKNPANAYCQAVIPPKLKKFKAKQEAK
jgi:peptide-methionine (S)-S-oxide reductase